MTSRDVILAKLRSAARKGSQPGVKSAAVELQNPRAMALSDATRRGLSAAQLSGVTADYATRVAQFSQIAAATQMTVAQVARAAELPAAVRQYLDAGQLQRRVVIDAELGLAAEQWRAAGLEADAGATAPDGDVYVRAGFAAIAACGAVVIASGAGRTLRNDFLAQTHIVVVPAGRLLPDFADLWALLRAHQEAAGPIAREICLVTGPSRTADLGVPAKLGAHGPARVHVLIDLGSDTNPVPSGGY